jgi:hypothetical protein
MPVETRGPFAAASNVWYVYVDGYVLPGFVELLAGGYHVHPGGMRGKQWPPTATLGEAAQALADFHAGKRR